MAPERLHKDLTVIILAGGKSTRMGSDKGLLLVNGLTFIEKLLKEVNQFSDHVIISVGEHNQAAYKDLHTDLVVDESPEKGPVGGIVSVLKNVNTTWYMLISVDSPMITVENMNKLWISKADFDGAVYSTGSKTHPLIGVYHRKTSTAWASALNSGKLKVMKVIDSMSLNKVQLKILNINTLPDYENLKKEIVNEY